MISCIHAASVAAQTPVTRIQAVVDQLTARLGIAEAVRVSIVPENRLLMSVEPGQHAFELKVEDGFADGLSDVELDAAVAHELGHVWIFTHHPFLQTEQLANEVAMRIVSARMLAQLYDKVWKRAGVKGDLARFLGPDVSRGLASPDPQQPPQPPQAQQQSAGLPELKPLERFLGTWTYDGADRTAQGGPVKCTSVRKWTGAGFYVESRRQCSTPGGDVQQLEVYGFDPSERVYRYWGFNGQRVSLYMTPAIDGPTIKWDNVALPGRIRCSETFDAGFASSTARCERSSDGTAWVVLSEGRYTRTAP